MHCTTSAGPCACAAPAGAGAAGAAVDGATVVVASATSHTLVAVRRAARAAGSDAVVSGTACTVRTADLGGLLDALDIALTTPEKEEARLLVVDEQADLDLVAQALVAPSVAVTCARRRQQPLGAALGDGATFHSAYQPIVDLGTGEPVAYEALLRGTVDGQPVAPAELFAAAEAAGWLHVLDRMGRERAISGAAGWLGEADLFVNFNPTSIYRPEVCLATTEAAVRTAGLRMDQLVFEVVESHHAGLDHLQDVLAHYRGLGCRVALDDVGAGYASLNALAAIAPDVVKLDRALVHRLPEAAAAAVIRSVVRMARDIGAVVVAECVETEAQLRAVAELGADLAQGWFFARPTPPPVPREVTPLPVGLARGGGPLGEDDRCAACGQPAVAAALEGPR